MKHLPPCSTIVRCLETLVHRGEHLKLLTKETSNLTVLFSVEILRQIMEGLQRSLVWAVSLHLWTAALPIIKRVRPATTVMHFMLLVKLPSPLLILEPIHKQILLAVIPRYLWLAHRVLLPKFVLRLLHKHVRMLQIHTKVLFAPTIVHTFQLPVLHVLLVLPMYPVGARPCPLATPTSLTPMVMRPMGVKLVVLR